MKKRLIDIGISGCALAALLLKSAIGGFAYAMASFFTKRWLEGKKPRG